MKVWLRFVPGVQMLFRRQAASSRASSALGKVCISLCLDSGTKAFFLPIDSEIGSNFHEGKSHLCALKSFMAALETKKGF